MGIPCLQNREINTLWMFLIRRVAVGRYLPTATRRIRGAAFWNDAQKKCVFCPTGLPAWTVVSKEPRPWE